MGLKVVLLHLDALSFEYFRRGLLPRTRSLLESSGLIPLFSGLMYEGITASMMTGREPAEHNVWVHFRRRQQRARWAVRVVGAVPQRFSLARGCRSYGTIHGRGSSAARRALWLLGQRVPWGRFQFVPLPWLQHFEFVIPRFDEITAYNSFGNWPTLAHLARQKGLRVGEIYGEWDRVVVELPKLLPKADFVFVHTLMELDHLGHIYGPESPEVGNLLTELDKSLAAFLPSVARGLGEGRLLVFSDHGMGPVTHSIDVSGLIKRALSEKQTLLFVDSTMIRVWTQKERLEEWRDRLAAIRELRLLAPEDRGMLPRDPGVVGDLLAVVHPGGLLLPNFWQGDQAVCGMHGYVESDSYQAAFFSVLPQWPDTPAKQAQPQDVFAVALATLEKAVTGTRNGL